MSRPILLDNDGNPFNRGFDLGKIISEMPAGLERVILRNLNFHKGRENAISRIQLLKELKAVGFTIDDRKMRACIKKMRKSEKPGTWICSTGGGNGGYRVGVA